MSKHLGTDYYVYGHYDGDDLVYIGKGKNHRAWECGGDKSRTPEHLEWLRQNLFTAVRPIALNLTEQEALEQEQKLVNKYKPKFNMCGTGKTWSRRGSSCTGSKLTEDDVILIKYYFLPEGSKPRELSKLFNVSRQTIHSIIRKDSWRHV